MKNKLIGLYQLVTGIYGAILLLYSLLNEFGDNKQDVHYTYILGIILFAGVAYAGYAMLNKIKDAKSWSIIAQSAQVLSFSTGSIAYKFAASAFVSFSFPAKSNFNTQLETIDYYIGAAGNSPQMITIYFMPIVLLVLLLAKR